MRILLLAPAVLLVACGGPADGGFRRLLVGRDGRISAADGAEPANVTPRGPAGTEVEIGGDRFRLPGL